VLHQYLDFLGTRFCFILHGISFCICGTLFDASCGMVVLLQLDVGVIIKACSWFISWVDEFLQMILPFFGLFLPHHTLGSWTQTRFSTLECGKARCWGKVKENKRRAIPQKAPPLSLFLFFSSLLYFYYFPLFISFNVNSKGFRNSNDIIATTTITN
jgi:hypothetical protein